MSPPQAQTSQKSSRRSRRPPRKPTGSTSSYVASAQDANLAAENKQHQQTTQPMRILRRGNPGAMSEIPPATDSDTPPPHTPPRPRSMYEGSANNQQDSNSEAPKVSHTTRKTPNLQGHKQSNAATPMPSINGTPISGPRRGSGTPTYANGTPVKAYAGPTFHASPAASSLPMPKFFSKSVPNIDKTKSLKTMLEQEVPDSSSGSEESPSLGKVQPTSDNQIREESPLDVFFRADRQAKSRIGSAPDVSRDMKFQAAPSQSPSRPQYQERNRSAGTIFPLEMDGASPEISSRSAFPLNPMRNSKQSSPTKQASPENTQEDREQQRKAQTLALKKLLFSPRPQLPHDSSAGQRPPSSKLRKEISVPTSPVGSISTLELPATPTPARVQKTPANLSNDHKTPLNGYTSPSPPIKPSSRLKQGHDNMYNHETSTPRSIENDLRRILKLDVLGGDSVPGH